MCACGCGRETTGTRGRVSTFLRGHHNRIGRVEADRRRCPRCTTWKAHDAFRAKGRWCRECERAYRQANRDRIIEQGAAWRAAHPGASTEAVRRWRAANPERYRETGRDYFARRRARKREAFVEMVDPALVLARSEGRCGICGEVIEGEFHVDHVVPLSRGGEHSYANTQAAHPACNLRKAAA
jgi:5-methylcytosine-specific restriction endonuclease McrA